MRQTLCGTIPGFVITKEIGEVTAESHSAAPGASVWVETRMVMAKMQGWADMVGADAIIGTRFLVNRKGGVIRVRGKGVAVKLKKIH